ncbi:MAG: hypothetical protein IKN17_13285 [Ruminococcus sp.]|nr:hypothetical protein [Ruminococcus sp.]
MRTVIDLTGGDECFEGCAGGFAGLVKLFDRELTAHTLDRLRRAGVTEVYLCAQRRLAELKRFAGDVEGMALTVCEPEEVPRDEGLLILGGDWFFTAEMNDLPAADSPSVLTCREPVGRGTALPEGLCGEGAGFAGAVYLPAGLAELYSGGMEPLLRELAVQGTALTPVTAHFAARLTDAAALAELTRYMLDNAGVFPLPEDQGRILTEPGQLPGVDYAPPVYAGRNVTFGAGCKIGAYSCIGADSAIGRRAVVSGAYIGENVCIGAHSEVCGALLAGASVGSSVRLGEQSLIGRGATVYNGATVCAGVCVYSGRRVFEGAYLCEDLVRGSAAEHRIGDDGCCQIGAYPSAVDVLRFGAAAASALPPGSIIVLAHSGSEAAKALCSCLRTGIVSGGCKVLELDEGSRQLLGFTLSRCGLPLGCFVSGGDDGLTLMSAGGLPLSTQTVTAIERACEGGGTRPVPVPEKNASAGLGGMRLLYEEMLRSLLPEERRLNISVRCPNRFIQTVADSVFSGFDEADCERVSFNVSADGSACSAYSREAGYVMHDRLLLLALRYQFSRGLPAAVPFEYTAAADRLAEESGGVLLRYHSSTDGSEDACARECAARCDNLFVRDGLALAALVTKIAHMSGKSFEALLSELPEIYCTQRYVGITERPREIARQLGTGTFGSGSELVRGEERAVIRQVRGSRGLMIFAESCSAEAAMSLCDELTARIRELSKK